MRASAASPPRLGFGVGLRSIHFTHVLEKRPHVDFFEAVTENFLGTRGRPLEVLDRVAERWPVLLHGVSMSIGSTDPLDLDYLRRVRELALRMRSPWVSDHVCWSSTSGQHLHDLLPLPYDEPTLRHVVDRARRAQDVLGLPLAFENPSTYLAFRRSTMPEWEFVARLAEEADCGLLLDVNNVYVSAMNHGFDPERYVDAMPADRVFYFHLAGHTRLATHILDTHSDHVADPVWRLYARAQERCGGKPTLLEWDESIPTFPVLERELRRAKRAAGKGAGRLFQGRHGHARPAGK
ncbi:MAG TPA: DUF692 domain-containing protein [Planctomycetota bacterium]|nr:DUF692 domain-containing protein [Planctomycetota bacterium]